MPRQRTAMNLIPFRLWQLKTLFFDGLIKFKKVVLIKSALSAFGRLKSNFFYPKKIRQKKGFLKNCVC